MRWMALVGALAIATAAGAIEAPSSAIPLAGPASLDIAVLPASHRPYRPMGMLSTNGENAFRTLVAAIGLALAPLAGALNRAPVAPEAATVAAPLMRIVPEEQQPPKGTWSCALPGGTVGTLTASGWHYELAAAGISGAGEFEPIDGRAAKNRATYLRVTSGPLREQLGIRLGLHDYVGGPGSLTFNIGPGSGIRCAAN